MKMKEFDWKQFMLQKGERVGLYTAAAIGGLLLIFSIWGVINSGSPRTNAGELKKESQKVDNLVATAQAPDDLDKVDKTLMGGAGKFDLLNALVLRDTKDFFEPLAVDNSKRLPPEIYTPVEWRATVAFAQIRSYIYDREVKRIMVLRGGPKNPRNVNQFNNFMAAAGGGGPRGGSGPGGGGAGIGGMFSPGMSPGMAPGAPPGAEPGTGSPDSSVGSPDGAPGVPGSGVGLPGMPGNPGLPTMSTDSKKEPQAEMIEFENLAKVADATPAENLLPRRIAIITGSFPYKRQLEEYRRALRHKTVDDLMASDDAPVFKGWVVERRTVGKDGQAGKWEKIDLIKTYKPIIALTGGRFEENDPKLEPIHVFGLMMKRPIQVPDRKYPEPEKDLPRVKETLAALEAAGKVKLIAGNDRFKGEGVDIFGNATDSTAQNPATTGVQTGSDGQVVGGIETFIPEYVPVRILDVTVRPGETYHYRIQFVAANPNFGRKQDVAYSELSKEKEIKSKPALVTEFPIGPDGEPMDQPVVANVTVPPELVYYAVDEKEQERVKNVPTRERKYNTALDLFSGNEYKDKAAIQIHKWVDAVAVGDKKTSALPSGEWLVADRIFAQRGEYLGRTMLTEVPVWLYTRDEFILHPNPKNARDKRIDLSFGSRNGPPDEAILVDFEGGKLTYEKGRDKPAAEDQRQQRAERVEAPAPVELLILAPDGKTLLARDSVTDSADPDREKRRKAWKDRIEELKNPKKDNKTAPQTPGGLFDPRSGSGK